MMDRKMLLQAFWRRWRICAPSEGVQKMRETNSPSEGETKTQGTSSGVKIRKSQEKTMKLSLKKKW